MSKTETDPAYAELVAGLEKIIARQVRYLTSAARTRLAKAIADWLWGKRL